MSRPWMPMYWGDYLADTRHLTLEQHGAYLMLIAHYWTQGALPPDDKSIRRIIGLNSEENRKRWKSICLAIAPLFQQPGWHHKRIDKELEKHRIISEKRQFAGRRGGLTNRGKDNNQRFINANVNGAIAKQRDGIPQPHIDSSTSSDSEIGTASLNGLASKQEKTLGVSSSLANVLREKGWAP